MRVRYGISFLASLAARALVLILIVVLGGSRLPAEAATAEDGAAGAGIFDDKCVVCHTIGKGVRKGPDLIDVHKRRDRDWLVRFITDPKGMSASDPMAQQLVTDWAKFGTMIRSKLTETQISEVLAYIGTESAKLAPETLAQAGSASGPVNPDNTKEIYFDRCAGCHGLLRKGATGPTIEPKRSEELGADGIETILAKGTPGGMPAFGKEGILSAQEIKQMAAFLMQPPPEPPQRPLALIKQSWKLLVPVANRPKAPQTKRDWENYFGVILRDAGKVAIVDGNTKELVKVIDTGFAVHILRSSSTGRYFYAVGRDGRVSMIDLWPENPQLVAQVQGCYDARSVDSSKYKGYEDKLVIEGCYWPAQYVVMDGLTLEPTTVVDVTTPTYDTNEVLKEVRVASIVASQDGPYWIVSLKESGHVAVVDYSKAGYPMVSKIPTERFLHDGGWDHTKRYFMVAANMREQMVVVDVKTQKMVTKFKTGVRPHPGRGANWEDPQYGWVNATPHLGEPKLVVYGADPEKKPQYAWKIVREIELPAPGGLFVKTHDRSPWVWIDSTLSNDPEAIRQVCVYAKKTGKLEKCFSPSDRDRVVHFDYDKSGSEVWVSVWGKEGALVVYDDKTLKEKKRITGDWLVTPTGKFNVYNTAHDIY